MAERVGFEPTVPVRVHRFSRPACSTSSSTSPLEREVAQGTRTDCDLHSPAAAACSVAALRVSLAQCLEELFQNPRAGRLEDGSANVDPMVEPGVVDHVSERTAGAGLWIVCADHQSGHPRKHQRAGAHRARFQRDVNDTVRQPLHAGACRRGPDGQHLRVRRGIVVPQDAVLPPPDNLPVAQNDRPHRHFAGVAGALGLGQRQLHSGFVRVVQFAHQLGGDSRTQWVPDRQTNIPLYVFCVNHIHCKSKVTEPGSCALNPCRKPDETSRHDAPSFRAKNGTSISRSCSPP